MTLTAFLRRLGLLIHLVAQRNMLLLTGCLLLRNGYVPRRVAEAEGVKRGGHR